MKAHRVLAVIVFALLLAGCFARHGDAQARLSHWNALLSKELPAGASKATVQAFFSGHGLESSYLPHDHAVVAIDRDVESGGMVTTSITFKCPLDQTERVESCSTAVVHTGP
jgi:hypothetical protein